MDFKTISHYRMIRPLGAGGMGEVYLAEDTKLDRKVAIKFLAPQFSQDERAKQRLVGEARAGAQLDHPNIRSIHDEVDEGSHSFIVMQYVEGETLSSKILGKPLKTRQAIDLILQVADALDDAHSHGIIHRDIKPANIIVTSGGQVKVLDFGLAKIVPHEPISTDETRAHQMLTDSGSVVGTISYMSPEQAKGGTVDTRSDLFSLGTTLYECLTGQPPFRGVTPIEVGAQVIHVNPPPPSSFNSALPPELDRLVLKALAKKPEDRYQSASELMVELRKVRDNLPDDEAPSDVHGIFATRIALILASWLQQSAVFSAAAFVMLMIALFIF